MRRHIYVGCCSLNIRRTASGDRRFQYLPIAAFTEAARKQGLIIVACKMANEVMMDCSRVYKITFKYKFSQRREFHRQLLSLCDQPVILKWYKIKI